MAAVGDYLKTLTRRIVALHEASATFLASVAVMDRITRSADTGSKWRAWKAGTRGSENRLTWDLVLRRIDPGRTQGPATFGNTSRVSPPTCPRIINQLVVYESIITGPDGDSDEVTALTVLSQLILVSAGNGLSPSGYADLGWVVDAGPITARFADVRLDPNAPLPEDKGPGLLVFRGRVDIPVAVSLVTTTDILGA
jgi:hypothetical protein